MDKEQFENLISQAVGALPKSIRAKLDNVDIVLEEGESLNNSLYGFYHGVPQTQRTPYYVGMLPDKITIYKGTIEKFAGSDLAIPGLVRRVVWHEIGHHFGFKEDEIRKLEQKWQKENKV